MNNVKAYTKRLDELLRDHEFMAAIRNLPPAFNLNRAICEGCGEQTCGPDQECLGVREPNRAGTAHAYAEHQP